MSGTIEITDYENGLEVVVVPIPNPKTLFRLDMFCPNAAQMACRRFYSSDAAARASANAFAFNTPEVR